MIGSSAIRLSWGRSSTASRPPAVNPASSYAYGAATFPGSSFAGELCWPYSPPLEVLHIGQNNYICGGKVGVRIVQVGGSTLTAMETLICPYEGKNTSRASESF